MDKYAIADAALRGVFFLAALYFLFALLRILRWLWRQITGVSISAVASTTGRAAGKVDGTVRRFADGFKEGFKQAKD